MARGASQSQASSSMSGWSGVVGIAPRGSTPEAKKGSVRCRLSRTSVQCATAVGGGRNGSNMLGFYTVEAPGLKIAPTVVPVKSWSQWWRRILLHPGTRSLPRQLVNLHRPLEV
uniref:Uncharacterized protein n=1 Tax=Nelumbo nucifera TaxID=4432 RepID=A0A822ZYD2_NELNU|nr:TPA_asm: hypothetical protein HUJ06_016875 [Nelumbo nucifera]